MSRFQGTGFEKPDANMNGMHRSLDDEVISTHDSLFYSVCLLTTANSKHSFIHCTLEWKAHATQ